MAFKNVFRTPIYIGILLGLTYGLGVRIAFGNMNSLDSLTFMAVIPFVLGMVPLLLAGAEHLVRWSKVCITPCVTVTACFIGMFITELETLLCLVLFAIPFFALAIAGALMVAQARLYFVKRMRGQRRNKTALSISLLVLPFILAPLEQHISKPTRYSTVVSEVIIDATAEEIWNNIVAVPAIKPEEYAGGVFHALGIPRPLRATVSQWAIAGQRTGYFEGGLQFSETITTYVPNKTIAFSIATDPQHVPDDVFQQHVLTGKTFAFVDATYTLTPLPDGRIKLALASSYTLTSTINAYGQLWGDLIVKDFQDRLLTVIRHRCEY